MIMMGLHFMGEAPFSRVLLAGLVTDERGEKMSKVKGNVIDPLDVIGGATLDDLLQKAEFNGSKPSGLDYIKKTYPDGFAEYGTDALRMTLLSYSPQSRRIALSLKRVEGYRNFANKLWNAARYALPKVDGAAATGEAPTATALSNRWILSRLAYALEAAKAGLDAYRLDEASGALYRFVWDELCDWYLELSKPLLDSDDAGLVAETKAVLVHVLETTLRALHPMMPFVTEEIWHRVPKTDALGAHPRDPEKPRSLIVARFPTATDDGRRDEAAERELAIVQAFVGAARSIRAEHDLPRARAIEIHYAAEPAAAEVLTHEARLVGVLAGATLHATDAAKIDDPHAHFENAAVFAVPGVKAVVPQVIDPAKERERLQRELKKLTKELDVLTKKLANASFVDRAPTEVVEKARRDQSDLHVQKDQLEGALARLGG